MATRHRATKLQSNEAALRRVQQHLDKAAKEIEDIRRKSPVETTTFDTAGKAEKKDRATALLYAGLRAVFDSAIKYLAPLLWPTALAFVSFLRKVLNL